MAYTGFSDRVTEPDIAPRSPSFHAMRVAFFGGTFDPPHRGHLAIATAAAKEFSLNTVLFAPTARQPLKPGGSFASFADRLAMVELLCAEANKGFSPASFVASTLDAPTPDAHPNYTIDTLHRLREMFADQSPAKPPAQVFVITGADAFLSLRRWREPDRLLETADWIVVSRPGFSPEGFASIARSPGQMKHVHLLEGVHETVSSSEVRTRLAAGRDCTSLLPQDVLAYILHHGLYALHMEAEGERA